ncbi:MAG: NADPH-dependent F420 reductase, partial [Acidimicrobiales bacterium]
MRITIVGAGNMGRGIATRAVAGGNEVELVDRNLEGARSLADELGPKAGTSDTVTGDLVVFALPYEEIAKAIEEHRDALAGRIVVDIANPVEWSTMERVTTPGGSSSAEE